MKANKKGSKKGAGEPEEEAKAKTKQEELNQSKRGKGQQEPPKAQSQASEEIKFFSGKLKDFGRIQIDGLAQAPKDPINSQE